MARRTYYYSRETADALAEAVARVHHESRGRVPKNVVLEAIITAGLTHTDEIAQRLI